MHTTNKQLNLSHVGDMEIWQEIKKDREAGARRLVAEYGNRLYAAAVLLSSHDHDAEELTFRTLDQAVKKIHLFDPERSFFTWLYAILLNYWRMELRRKKRSNVIAMGATGDLPEVACDTFAALLDRSGEDDITQAVRALSGPMREAVVLRYYADKPLEEIAHLLNVPVGTVKSRLHHAREALYERLSRKKRRSS